MNRRVLLIDGDSAFRETLSRQLGRYRVVVMTEADPERGLALATSDPPDLVVIAVEEPEKQGFKTFQKARKALPAKLPIVLVTSTLPPDSFAKHRGMKSHADEYLDKRDLSDAELVGKIDNLIGLGEPDAAADDDLPIAEDIPMELADGDVVLDEQLDDDDVGSFAQDPKHDMATINPNSEVLVDRMVAQETDAAFDALLGDDMFGGGGPVAPEPAATMVDPGHDGAEPDVSAMDDGAPVEVEASAIEDAPVEVDASAIEDAAPDELEAAPEPIDAAPEPIDGAPEPIDAAPEPIDAAPEPIEAAPEPIEAAPVAVEAAEDSGIPEPVPHKIPDESSAKVDAESVPAPIRDGGRETGDDFDSYSKMAAKQAEPHADPVGAHAPIERMPSSHDDDFEEEEAPHSRDSLSAIPIVDDDLVSLDDDMPVEVEDEAPAPEPAPAPVAAAPPTRKSSPTAAPPIPERKSKPTVAPEPVAEPVAPPVAAVPQPVAAVPQVAAAAEKASGPTPVAAEKASGPNPTVDLGLDSIAQNVEAEREQSGVYDHKGLRKIGELERQISQLKTELDRARSTADAAAKGSREAQFLNLREGNLAKEKELKDAKKSLEQHAKDLAEANERLKQALHAKEKLEAQNAKLEAQIFDSREKELEEQLTAATAKLAELERDADTKGKLVVKAEAAITQLEQDLATERANRAAGASEAEQRLHAEREQLLQRHKSELAAQQAEAASSQEAALARLREELEGAAAANLDQTIEELRRANAQEHTEAVDAIEKKYSSETVNLKAEQAGELARLKNELGGRIAELEGALAEANQSHVAALAGAQDAGARASAELEAKYQAELDEATQAAAAAAAAHEQQLAQLDAQHKAELAAATNAASAAAAAHQSELEQQKAKYEAEIAAREEELEEARERDAESHGQAIAQLKATLDRATASHEVKLASAQREVQELQGQHEAALAQLAAQHEAAIAELRAKHDADLGSLSDGAKRTQETHRAALAEQQQKYEAQIAELSENAEREIAETRGQVHAAKKAAEEAAARATAEREELQQSHASQIGELEAKHERALAVTNGEALKAKAVADAEHTKEINALKAEADRKLRELEEAHARLVSDMTAERDELKKGLSTARDQLKRTDNELASAVQTIADRNADLRAHAAAIAERDQRIAELRAEIESIEGENANYQEQVLRAYQKIKSDEAMVARARKAMAIALTVLDDQGNPTTTKSES